MRDLWDADAMQVELYERAGLDPNEPAQMLALARGLGLGVLMMMHPPFVGDGMLQERDGRYTVLLRSKVSRERKRFALAHEIAEWALRGVVDEQIEDACNAVAAALLAPRRAFLAQANDVGETNWEQLALPFGMTQTAAALRAGEVLGMTLAVVRPGLVRVRGSESWVWPEEGRIRAWATGDAGPGLRKAPITDSPRRMALVADEDEALDDHGPSSAQLALGW